MPWLITAALMVALCGCSGQPAAPDSTSGPSTGETSIVITGAGVSPKTLQVRAGTRVLFINNDTRPHEMSSDDHPEHLDCPELNQVGFLRPGERRETGNLVTPRTCGFHDHLNAIEEALNGRIVVTE